MERRERETRDGAAAAAAERLGRRSEGLVSALAAAGASLLLQGGGPTLQAAVDEDRVAVGEEVTYTLRAVSRSPVPMQVTVRAVQRLRDRLPQRAHRGRPRRDGATRTTRARGPAARGASRPLAARPGARGAGHATRSRPARRDRRRDGRAAAATASTLNPRLRRCWSARRRRRRGRAAVDLAGRLGRHGARGRAGGRGDRGLVPARPAAAAPPPADAAAAGDRRRVELSPGGARRHRRDPQHRRHAGTISSCRTRSCSPWCRAPSTIPRATLKYSTPVALQFFSQEERFALTSRRGDARCRRCRPRDGRPDFTGAVGVGPRARAAGHAGGRAGRRRR